MATTQTVDPEPRKWIIRSGPSKYDFFESLAFRKPPRQLIILRLRKADEIEGGTDEFVKTQIFLISKWVTPDDDYPSSADGMIGGHEWKFVGVLSNYDHHVPDPQFRSVWVIGHYSTKTREGKVTELPVSSELFQQLFSLFF